MHFSSGSTAAALQREGLRSGRDEAGLVGDHDELDGLEATGQITSDRTLNDTRVLVLTTFELDEYVFGALRAGASGFLLKGGEPGELLSAIRLVAAGESLLAPSVTRRLIEAYIAQPEHRTVAPDGLDELSPRELEVLELVAQGSNNREIAEALRARDRVQLVVIAYQAGLVSP